jgi:acyl carrier protein
MAIEKEFDIEIFDDDIESTKTLGDLELLIDAKSQVTK